MSEIELRPLHCGISVSNLEEAVAWFERVLDFEFDRDADMSHVGFKIAFVRKGDFQVELFEHSLSQPAPPDSHVPDEDLRTRGMKHMCFEVPDLSRMIEHFKACGVEIAMGPLPAAGLNILFVHGPDGTLIEFAETAKD